MKICCWEINKIPNKYSLIYYVNLNVKDMEGENAE